MRLPQTVFLAAALFLAGVAAPAEGIEVPFGSNRHDITLPVEVTADRLEVDQVQNDAVFTGGVVVGQGEMRLSTDRLRVTYAKPGANGASRIDRMHATGGVLVTSANEAAEAREAIYSITDGTIIMMGDVLLTQGNNAISGQRFIVDLNTGKGVMEGRVTTILQSGGGE